MKILYSLLSHISPIDDSYPKLIFSSIFKNKIEYLNKEIT